MNGKSPDHNGVKMMQENYSNEEDTLSLHVEMPILNEFFRCISGMFSWYC